MSAPRIGSLFTGYGGLDMATESVTGGHTVWVCEHEPPTPTNPRPTQAAARLLAHRRPGTPNLGDITTVNWTTVPPVDVLTGGFPCQDLSLAGLRGGLRPDTRSGLWSHMAAAIDTLRPALVVIENVRGLLSAEAHGQLEPCPWCVGNDGSSPLRALGAVLGDLADLGYDARWIGLRAADVGAPHGRYRIFVTARPAQDADIAAGDQRRVAAPGQAEGRRAWADAGRRGGAPAADTNGDAVREQPVAVTRCRAASVAGLPGTSAPADSRPSGRRPHLTGLRPGQPDPGRGAASDAHGDGLSVLLRQEPGLGARDDVDRRGPVDWGQYGDAVRRWELLTRPAPTPTEASERGAHRLSPAFVEWMMGLPAGHVTAVPGLTRADQLRVLGNGVVPQQAAAALRALLTDATAAA